MLKRLFIIITSVLMGIIPFELLCQEQNDEMKVSFTKIKLKDDKQFLGEMVKKTDSTVIFHDNVFGEIILLTVKVREIQEEDTSRVYLITLINGNSFNGKIVSKEKQQFDLKTNLGTLTLKADMVKDAERLDAKTIVSEDYWFPNPNATRYFFAPSAIPIKKGEGYYQNAYLLANMANYGITGNFSFGGGVILPFAAFIAPKVGFEVTKNINPCFHMGPGSCGTALPLTRHFLITKKFLIVLLLAFPILISS